MQNTLKWAAKKKIPAIQENLPFLIHIFEFYPQQEPAPTDRAFEGLFLPRAGRLGDRKSVRANHPPDGPPSLFAHLSGEERFAFLFHGGQPPRPRSLLKKAGENFILCSPLAWRRVFAASIPH